MKIIRDKEDKAGLFIIPLLKQYGVSRCNFKGCNNKPNTIAVTNQVNLGFCEMHFKELENRQEEENLQIEFFFNTDPNLDSKNQNHDSKP